MPNHSDAQSTVLLSSPTDRALEGDTLAVVQAIAQAAEDRKGVDLSILRVDAISTLADYFVIVTGLSKAQVRAIAVAVADAVEEGFERHPIHLEGQAEATWVLLDYGDIIVHVQMPHEREFYNLEAFWGHAERVNLSAID
ncbi:MAG TPA: ribosome silencing factor [Thermosynechococcaceae cyanobacterium]|jgi:ribosome-associated protein